ncbi:unnamed protein product [Meloidogyne enterolobii]|uniref:Uncharacterized protein n=1 Tax=Meloidogyne enterolobii TaxID=390850 RepID=A0ACB1AR34_MELEN
MSKSITNFIFILLILKLNLFLFVESTDDKCGKDLKLVQKFFKFLYNDEGINKEFKDILLKKYSTFLTKIANKKARKARKTKETKENLIEENVKNDSPKSSDANSLKSLNTEVSNNKGINEGRKEVQIVQTFNELLNENKDDNNKETSEKTSLPGDRNKSDSEGWTGEGRNKEQMEPQKVQTFTELLNENSDDNEAEHLTEDRNKLDMEGWISPESSSRHASRHANDNIDNYKDADKEVESTPEVGKGLEDVDLACEARTAQIIEELFRDIETVPETEHKEEGHIPEHLQEVNNHQVEVDLISNPSPSNDAPNHPSPSQQMPNYLLARNTNNGDEAPNLLSFNPSSSQQVPNNGNFIFVLSTKSHCSFHPGFLSKNGDLKTGNWLGPGR